MKFTYADTKYIEEVGKNIIDGANKYNLEITKLFKRLTNIPFETEEWTGNKAESYSALVGLDKQQYIDFYYLLKSFGESVIESANQIDICVKATVEGKINNVKN